MLRRGPDRNQPVDVVETGWEIGYSSYRALVRFVSDGGGPTAAAMGNATSSGGGGGAGTEQEQIFQVSLRDGSLAKAERDLLEIEAFEWRSRLINASRAIVGGLRQAQHSGGAMVAGR